LTVDEEQPPGAGAVARDQALGQAIWLVSMCVAIPLLAWLERQAKDPDFARTVKMRAAKAAERFCAQAARNWWGWAERARLAYEAERPL
jgi:hypothetical protein